MQIPREHQLHYKYERCHLEILLFKIEYLEDEGTSKNQFASVNQNLSRVLLRKERRIRMLQMSLKWTATEIRSQLLKMIENPYNQLSFSYSIYVLILLSYFHSRL